MATRIVSNSGWNFGAFAFSVLANLLAIPFVVRNIGLPAFGQVGLLLGIIAPLSLIGTVIGQATVRAVSEPRQAAHDGSLDDALWAAWVLGTVACATVALAFGAGAGLAVEFLAAGAVRSANDLLPLVVALGWAGQQLGLILQSAFAGAQRYRDVAMATSAGALCSVGATVLFTWLLPNALGYAIGLAIGFALSLGVWLGWTVARFPHALRPRAPSAANLRAILHFGKWQSIAHLAGAAGLQADRYLLGMWAPFMALGQYGVAVRLQEVAHMAVLKLSEVLFPHFGATAGDSADRRAEFFARASWLVGLVAVAVIAPLIPLASALLTLWIGVDAADAGAPVLRTLLTASVLGAGATVFTYHALGTGRGDQLAGINLAHAVLTLMLSVPFILYLGLAGAGWGILVANALRLVWCWRLARRHFEGHLQATALSHLAATPLLAGLAVGWLVHSNLAPGAGTWLSLAGWYGLLACLTATIAAAATGIGSNGRKLLRAALQRPAPANV